MHNEVKKLKKSIDTNKNITSAEAIKMLKFLCKTLDKKTTLEDALKIAVEVKNEDKRLVEKEWNDLRDFAIKSLIDELVENKIMESKDLLSDIEFILTSVENIKADWKSDYAENVLDKLYENDFKMKIVDVFGKNTYAKYLTTFLSEIKSDILDGYIDENNFGKEPTKLKINDLKYGWLYQTRCDSYDCDNETGDYFDLLSKIYRIDEDEIGEHKLNTLYEYAISPDSIDEGEYAYHDVEPVSDIPDKRKFALLLWKFML